MSDEPTGARPPGPGSGRELVRAPVPGPIELSRELPGLLLSANREFTFGFLLGYLSLAVHGTLQYPRYAQYYVGPWVRPTTPTGDEEVEYWTKSVARRIAYTSELGLGEVVAVMSDGPTEPGWLFERLGANDPKAEPPARVVVRTRLPRVDLILRPVVGYANDLYDFAYEIRERFNRQLD